MNQSTTTEKEIKVYKTAEGVFCGKCARKLFGKSVQHNNTVTTEEWLKDFNCAICGKLAI